jgi:hypothetical protein
MPAFPTLGCPRSGRQAFVRCHSKDPYRGAFDHGAAGATAVRGFSFGLEDRDD